MVQLIKKGGLRERANRSRTYQGSENTETTLHPNSYSDNKKQGFDQDNSGRVSKSAIATKAFDPSKPDTL